MCACVCARVYVYVRGGVCVCGCRVVKTKGEQICPVNNEEI